MSMLNPEKPSYANERFAYHNCDPLNMRPFLQPDGTSCIISQTDGGIFIWKQSPEDLPAVMTRPEWATADALIDATVEKYGSLSHHLMKKYPELRMTHSDFVKRISSESPPMISLMTLQADDKLLMCRHVHSNKLLVSNEHSSILGFTLLCYRTRTLLKLHNFQLICLLPPDNPLFWESVKSRVCIWSAMSHPERTTCIISSHDYSKGFDVKDFTATVVDCLVTKEEEGFKGGKWALVYPKDGLLSSTLIIRYNNGEKEISNAVTELMDAIWKATEDGIIQGTLVEYLSYEPPPFMESNGMTAQEAARIERSFQLIHIEKESMRIVDTLPPTLIQLDEHRFDILSSTSAYYIPNKDSHTVGIIDFTID